MLVEETVVICSRIPTSVILRRGENKFRINGNRRIPGRRDYGIFGGIAYTRDIPKSLWEFWLSKNRESPIVKRILVFAYEPPRNEKDS
jgi:hypothetical protein